MAAEEKFQKLAAGGTGGEVPRNDQQTLSEKKEGKLEKTTHVKRPICERCKRPKKVCICEAIPDKPLEISTTVYILQHPEECHRTLTTVPLLSACLPKDKCIVYNDVRYSQEKYSGLHETLKCPQTLVLYPDENARDLREVVKESRPPQNYTLVVPDGTWRQARKIFKKNDALQLARKVQLKENTRSHYVIRTQPTRNSLSTLEAVAMALSIIEGRDEIIEVLRRPLQLLCDIQLQHGAVPHASKEEKKEQELLQLELNEKVDEKEVEEKEEKNEQGHCENEEKNIKNQEENEDREEVLRQTLDQTKRIQRQNQEHDTEQAAKRSKLDE